MISNQQAFVLASRFLEANCHLKDDSYMIVEAGTIETDFAWVFFYNSKKFLETGENGRRLAGNGPLIVDKADSSIHPFGTAKRPEEYIEEYGKRRGGESAHPLTG